MTRIEQLRQRFAAGMAQGTISAEDWEEEFLPMIANSERYVWLRDKCKWEWESQMPDTFGSLSFSIEFDSPGTDVDDAIDSARTPTKEQTE